MLGCERASLQWRPSLQATDRAQGARIWMAREATDMRCGIESGGTCASGDQIGASITDVGASAGTVMLQLKDPLGMIECSGCTRWSGEPDDRKLLRDLILSGCPRVGQITSKPSIHRVSRSLPRLDSAFQHLNVGKSLCLIFRCLTDSARFGGSSSIEDDFLCLRQRRRSGLQAGEGYGPVQI